MAGIVQKRTVVLECNSVLKAFTNTLNPHQAATALSCQMSDASIMHPPHMDHSTLPTSLGKL